MQPLALRSIRAVVLDDVDVLRVGVTQLLRRFGAGRVVDGCAAAAAQLLGDGPVADLVVLGAGLGARGPEVCRAVRLAVPTAKVVVLVGPVERARFADLLRAGAHAVIPLTSDERGLADVLGQVLADGASFDGVQLDLGARAAPLARLSPREREVLALLATRRTLAEIAAELFVSLATVKSHTASLYRKLDVGCRADAVRRIDGALA